MNYKRKSIKKLPNRQKGARVTVQKINKIIKTLLEAEWNKADETAEKLLGGEYTDLYYKRKGVIDAAYKELLPVYKKLDNLEWHNEHSKYMIEIARFCEDEKYIKIFQHILDLHNLDGSMLHNLGAYRDYHYANMLKKYEEKLQPMGIYPMDTEEGLPF